MPFLAASNAVSTPELAIIRQADAVALWMAKRGLAGTLEHAGLPDGLHADVVQWIAHNQASFQQAVEYFAFMLRTANKVVSNAQ